MSKFKKIVITIISIIIIIPLCLFGYLKYKMKNMTVTSDYISEVGEVDGIKNILLLGADKRASDTNFRTDCMMILTIDNNNKNIKLTSLARDTYVNIPGKGMGKLNTAYFWGREKLLFETIEKEFNIGLDKYVLVDFNSLMDIIYALDGVEVDVKKSELKQLNKYIPECYKFCENKNKGTMKLIKKPGKQTLNGYQALSYTRIRKNDSAINRDQRQRKVINAIIKKYKNTSIIKYPALIDSLTPYVTTNLSAEEILQIVYTANNIFSQKPLKEAFLEGQFPIIDDIHSKGGKYKNAGWVFLYDINSTGVLRDFIYSNVPMKENDYMKDNTNITLNY